MINYVKKDITTVERGIIAHGVNCQVAMGSGVAKALYEKWPKVRSQYMDRNAKGREHLGKVDSVSIVDPRYFASKENALWVANCYTQEYYGRQKKRYAEPWAIEKSLDTVLEFASRNFYPVYIPRIGCGLAGLDWDNEIEPIVLKLSEKYGITINVCDI